MNDLAEQNEQSTNVAQREESQGSALVTMIERASRDPNVDIEKMERMYAMYERETARQAEAAFNAALTAAQAEMRRVAADAENPQTKSRYASYAALDRALRPIYTKHGFALSFDTGDTPLEGHIRVLCYVSHEQGHSRTYHRDVPVTTAGLKGNQNMTPTHASASAESYGRRYLLKGIFNVAVGEDDDDGNGANGPERINADQAATIESLIEEVGANRTNFLRYCKVNKVEDIAAHAYDDVIRALKKKRSQ